MAWVAFDRGLRLIEELGREGPDEHWRRVRDEIRAEVLEQGFDEELGSFVQSYGSKRVDASLLTIPLYGFLPADDPRVRGTLEAVRRELLVDGFVQRYRHDEEVESVDGLPPGEGAFFLCSFWFVDNLILLGELDEAAEMFDRLLSLRNELGLLSEEYDPKLGTARRQLPAGVLAHRPRQHGAAARRGAAGRRGLVRLLQRDGALTSARWTSACGKLPRCSPVSGSISSP